MLVSAVVAQTLLEPVAAGQTRFRMQGLTPDARGIAVGRELLMAFPSIDWLVSFLGAYSDEASLDVAVHNVEGPAAPYTLAVTNGSEQVETKLIDLRSGERRSEHVAIKPSVVGQTVYDVHVTGPDGIDVKRQLTFDVKPGDNEQNFSLKTK